MSEPTSTFIAVLFTIVSCHDGSSLNSDNKCGDGLAPDRLEVSIDYAENCNPDFAKTAASADDCDKKMVDVIRVERDGKPLAVISASILTPIERELLSSQLRTLTLNGAKQ